MRNVAVAVLLLLSTSTAEAARGQVRCAVVREAVQIWGIEAARDYAKRYLTPAQIAWAKRCLKRGLTPRQQGSVMPPYTGGRHDEYVKIES